MPRGHDPSRAVDIDARVVAAAQHGLADMHAHPDADLRAIGPGVFGQRPLGRHRRTDCFPDGREHGEHGVSLGRDQRPAVRADRVVEQLKVVVQHCRKRVSEQRDETGGTFDIGHEERDRAGWKVPHGPRYRARPIILETAC